MDQLWDHGGPQTVRQVHHALSRQRHLAYNTVMTVLQRLHQKRLVLQIRDDRAYQYLPQHGREELVADLMVDALDQATGRGDRRAALIQFAKRVGAEEADALRDALARVS
jgi:predicted transcriptional regulator